MRSQQTPLEEVAPCLAPEVARGERATPASDVYGLAALLCLAGGSPPPFGENALAILHQVATGAWKPRLPQHATGGLRNALGQMLNPDPHHRPTAEETAELFNRWHEDAPLRSVASFRTNRPLNIIAASAVLLLVAAGVPVLFRTVFKAPPQAAEGVQIEPNAEPEPVPEISPTQPSALPELRTATPVPDPSKANLPPPLPRRPLRPTESPPEPSDLKRPAL